MSSVIALLAKVSHEQPELAQPVAAIQALIEHVAASDASTFTELTKLLLNAGAALQASLRGSARIAAMAG